MLKSVTTFDDRTAGYESADDALAELAAGRDLTRAQSRALFAALVEGALDEPAIEAMLIGLRCKGETAEELIGAATALRAADVDFARPDYLFADSCGTGGDGSGSINVSTAVAFVAAAAGLPVAKHGNRSFSSKCGSADVLELMGAKLELDPARSRKILDETGFCFLFAPAYHPGLRHAGPVRRRLKVRTVMNLLGPCLNPAEPPVQLLGVADPSLLEKVATVLRQLGVRRALVVHGSGLDEVAIHGPTQAVRLADGEIEPLTFTPAPPPRHCPTPSTKNRPGRHPPSGQAARHRFAPEPRIRLPAPGPPGPTAPAPLSPLDRS